MLQQCPRCKRDVEVKDGVFDFHDEFPPCRSLCPNSKRSVLAAESLLSFRSPQTEWKWPPTTDGIIDSAGKVNRDALTKYIIQLCVARFLKMTTPPSGYSFSVMLGPELKREHVNFSMPDGPTPMLKITVPFKVLWDGPDGNTGSCSGNEQLFWDEKKKDFRPCPHGGKADA